MQALRLCLELWETGKNFEKVHSVFLPNIPRYFTTLPISELVLGDNFALLDNLSPYTNYQVHLRIADDQTSSQLTNNTFFSTSGKRI